MTAQNLLNFFEELIDSPEKAGDVETITQKSMDLFNEIVDRLKNSTPDERSKLQDELTLAAEKMSREFDKLCEKYGMTREEMENMVNDPSNFDSETWSSIESLKKDISNNQQNLIQNLSGSSEPTLKKKGKKQHSKKKTSKKWINA